MKKIIDAIKAMQSLSPEDSRAVFRCRAAVPGGEIELTNGVLALHPLGPIYRPGLTPEFLVHMAWIAPSENATPFVALTEGQEWAGILSLLLDRRVEALQEVPISEEGSDNWTLLPIADRIDGKLMAPPDLVDLNDRVSSLLRKVISLASEEQHAISSAIQLHHSASLLYVSEINTAYTLAVAGIEVLSRVFGSPPNDWGSWHQSSHWDRKFERIGLSEVQISEMREMILKDQNLRLSRTFVQYVMDMTPMTFWAEPTVGWSHSIDFGSGTFLGGAWDDESKPRLRWHEISEPIIENAIRETYQVRNGFVHSGIRPVSFESDYIEYLGMSELKRLPFEAVRSLLRFLIRREIGKRSTELDIDLPEFHFNDSPE